MVISWDPVVELDMSRECDALAEETVEMECSDGLYSPSEWCGVSRGGSSGIDAGTDLCEAALLEDMVNGRMMDHGGDSFKSSASCGSSLRLSHALICFATQGFCVQRSLEK